jgi:hypothetical protein
VQYVTEDAVFTSMNTRRNRLEAIGQMLNYFYYAAFDARAEITNKVITGKKSAEFHLLANTW